MMCTFRSFKSAGERVNPSADKNISADKNTCVVEHNYEKNVTFPMH